MSQRGDSYSPAARTGPERFFHLGPGRPLRTILLILAFLGGSGLGFGALLGADVDVDAFVPERGPDRVAGVGLGAAVSGPAPPEGALSLQQIGDPGDQPGGVPERFGPNGEGVLVVPNGWKVLTRTGDLIRLGTGGGLRFAARIVGATPSTPATQVVTDAGAAILSPNVAAHVRTSTVIGLQPFGSLVTRSAMGYSALRTDTQGLSSVAGNVFAFVRDDGLVLVVNSEVTPAAHWETRIGEWFPLWQSVVSNFAGAPVPT